MVFPLLPGSTPTPPPRHGPEINGSVLRDPPGVPNPTNGGGVIPFPHTKPGVPTSWKTSPTSPTTPLTDLGRPLRAQWSSDELPRGAPIQQ